MPGKVGIQRGGALYGGTCSPPAGVGVNNARAQRSDTTPQLSTEVMLNPVDLAVPAGAAEFAVERIERLAGGFRRLEFPTAP